MGRQSAVDRLPADLREALDAWLRDRSVTQARAVELLNAALAERGSSPVSKSSINRYSMRMEKVGEKLRQSQVVADAWIGRLGSQPGGKLGHLIANMIRHLVFEVTLKLDEAELDAESMPGMVKQLDRLALAASRIERASAESERRERHVREEARKQAAEELAERAAADAGGKAVDPGRLREIAREVYGVER